MIKKNKIKILIATLITAITCCIFLITSHAQQTSNYTITNTNVTKTFDKISLNIENVTFNYTITNNDNYLLINITNLSENLILNNKYLSLYYNTNSNYTYNTQYDYTNLKLNYDLYFYYIDQDGKEQAYQPYEHMSISFGNNFDQSENYYKDYENNPYSTAEEGSNINYQFLHYNDSGEPDLDFNFNTPSSGDYSRYLNLKIYIFEINILSDSMIYGSYDFNEQYNNGYNNGYNTGYNSGYNTGYGNGQTNGYDNGYNTGKQDGITQANSQINEDSASYISGYNRGANSNNNLGGMVITIMESPINMFKQMFNFDILGFNISSFLFSLVSLLLIAYIIKKLIK